MAVTPQVIRVASATDLQTQVNAYLSTLFGASSVLVLGVTIDSRANAPFFNANFVATITTNPTGAAVQAAPFQFVTFTAPIEADVLTLCNAFIAANPTFFFSQVFAIYRPDEPNPVQGVTLGLFFCSDAANAASNWKSIASSGSPSGAAGGDLGATYPNPTVVGWRTKPLDPITMAAPALNNVPVWDGTKWVAGSAPAGAINTGLTLWVDSVFGNNATAQRQRQDLPFLTVAAAVAAASSGDLVYVRPGVYNEGGSALSKNGVTVYTPAGVTINFSGFAISNPGTFTILGQGDWVGAAGSRFINISSANQNIQVQARDISTTAGGGTSFLQGNSSGNFVKIRCRNLTCDINANGLFAFGNSWAIASNTLDVWADENISNPSATALGILSVRGNAPSYRIGCGRTMSTGGGSIIDTTSGGSANVTLQADVYSAPNGLIGTGAVGTTYTVSGRVITASVGAGVNWASGGTLNLSGFATISGVTSGLNITAGTVSILGTAPNISASAGPGITSSGATVTGAVGTVTGTTFGMTTASGTITLDSARTISASAGPGLNNSGATLTIAAFANITGTTFGATFSGGTTNLIGNIINGTAGPGMSLTGVIPTVNASVGVVQGVGGLVMNTTFGILNISGRTLAGGIGTGGIAADIVAGVSASLTFTDILAQVGAFAGIRQTGTTNQVKVSGARIVSQSAAPVQRDTAGGVLLLASCSLVATGLGASIAASVATTVIINCDCAANTAVAGTVTLAGAPFTVNANIQ